MSTEKAWVCLHPGCRSTRQKIPYVRHNKTNRTGVWRPRFRYCEYHMDPENRLTPEERRTRLLALHR